MSTAGADDLNLRFPSDSSYLGISRLNATAVAAGGNFDIDELDDLRLAVGEAMAWLLSRGDSQALVDMRMTCTDGLFVLSATVEGDSIGDDEPDDLVHAILGATVDEYSVTSGPHGTSITVTLSKTAANA